MQLGTDLGGADVLQMLLEESKFLNRLQELSFDNALNHKYYLSPVN